MSGLAPIHRFYFACAIPTVSCPPRRGFRRLGTTDLCVLLPHLIRYWSMKRESCARAANRMIGSPRKPGRGSWRPLVENRDEWGSLFRGDPIKIKNQTVWASPCVTASLNLCEKNREGGAAALKHVGYKKPVAGCQFSVLSLFLRRENGSGSAVHARKWRLRRVGQPLPR